MILRPTGLQEIKKNLELARLMDFSDLVNFDSDPRSFREKIMDVENRLNELPQAPIKYDHAFKDGVYLRTMVAPKGILITSYIYRKPHQCIIYSGKFSYRTEGGGGTFEGPFRFTGEPGAKRLIFCYTEVVWTTVVKTDATNVQDAEKDIFFHTYEQWDKECCANIIQVGG